MIPDLDLARARAWVDRLNSDMPAAARTQIRYEIDVTDRAITLVECRAPWNPDLGSTWSRAPVCRFRYTRTRNEWSLYWRDRNLEFHQYDPVAPTPHLDQLVNHVDSDRSGLFWG